MVFSVYAVAQKGKKDGGDNPKRAEADALFDNEEYAAAHPIYSQLLSLDQYNADLNYRFGVCELFAGKDKEKAISYLKFATEKGAPVEAYFFLGRAYHLNYRFGEALANYDIFKEKASGSLLKKYAVDRNMEMCRNGQKLLRHIRDLVVIERKDVNADDFFRSYGMTEDFGGKVFPLSDEFKSKRDREQKGASVMYITNKKDEIYISSYGNNSDNLDIYRISKDINGEWSAPENLGSTINTPYDEAFPFLHPDGRTLYFASKGHNSMGGYDVFKSVYNEESHIWSPPVNVDFAINTPADDVLFVVDKKDSVAFFASNRACEGGKLTVYKIRTGRLPDSYYASTRPGGSDGDSLAYTASEMTNRAKLDVNSSPDLLALLEKEKQKNSNPAEEKEAAAPEPEEEKVDIEAYSNLTPDKIVNMAYEDADRLNNESKGLRRDADAASMISEQKRLKAQDQEDQANRLDEQVAYEVDDQVKDRKQKEAKALHQSAARLRKEYAVALRISQQLDSDADERMLDARQATENAQVIEKAMNANSTDEALKILARQKAKLEEKGNDTEVDYNAIAQDAVDEVVSGNKEDLVKSEAFLESLDKDVVDFQRDASILRDEADKTKDAQVKQELIAQAEDLEAESKSKQQKAEEVRKNLNAMKASADEGQSDEGLAQGIVEEIKGFGQEDDVAENQSKQQPEKTTPPKSDVNKTEAGEDGDALVMNDQPDEETEDVPEAKKNQSDIPPAEQPDVKPEESGTKSDQPDTQTGQPDTKSEQSNTKPEQPDAKTGQLDVEKDQPASENDQQEVNPEHPAEKDAAKPDDTIQPVVSTDSTDEQQQPAANTEPAKKQEAPSQWSTLSDQDLTARASEEKLFVSENEKSIKALRSDADILRSTATNIPDPDNRQALLDKAARKEAEADQKEKLNTDARVRIQTMEEEQKLRKDGVRHQVTPEELAAQKQEVDGTETASSEPVGKRPADQTGNDSQGADTTEDVTASVPDEVSEDETLETAQTTDPGQQTQDLREEQGGDDTSDEAVIAQGGKAEEPVETGRDEASSEGQQPVADETQPPVTEEPLTADATDAEEQEAPAVLPKPVDKNTAPTFPDTKTTDKMRADAEEGQVAVESQRAEIDSLKNEQVVLSARKDQTFEEMARAKNSEKEQIYLDIMDNIGGMENIRQKEVLFLDTKTDMLRQEVNANRLGAGETLTYPESDLPKGTESLRLAKIAAVESAVDSLKAARVLRDEAEAMTRQMLETRKPDERDELLRQRDEKIEAAESLEEYADRRYNDVLENRIPDPGATALTASAGDQTGKAAETPRTVEPTQEPVSTTPIKLKHDVNSVRAVLEDNEYAKYTVMVNEALQANRLAVEEARKAEDLRSHQLHDLEEADILQQAVEKAKAVDDYITTLNGEKYNGAIQSGDNQSMADAALPREKKKIQTEKNADKELYAHTSTGEKGKPILGNTVSMEFTTNGASIYNASNPIPIDPPLPQGLIFKVQVGAFRNAIRQDLFGGIKPLAGEKTASGMIRYTAGIWRDYKPANQAKGTIRDLGFRDAFVVAFYNGKRIPLYEAAAIAKGEKSGEDVLASIGQTGTGGTSNGSRLGTGSNTGQPSGGTTNPATSPGGTNTAGSTVGNSQAVLQTQGDLAGMKGIVYTVQVGVYSKALKAGDLNGLSPIYTESLSNGTTRYTTGKFTNLEAAAAAKRDAVNKGVTDAFVIAFRDGKRISLGEAGNVSGSNGTTNTPVTGGSENNTSSGGTKPPADIFEAISSNESGVVFRVQIGAYRQAVPSDLVDLWSSQLKRKVKTYRTPEGVTLYSVGDERSYNGASTLKAEVAAKGLEGAFIAAYEDGKPVSMQRAMQQTSGNN
ncbi:MAG: PD40 domain-containing protein [Flavobacteriales bacterium]|nr:PD40 domain-containing protein [Flavobacteriales bacterium]MCB9447799.1 PD40 domain-containing protein [Flavobacteriales bacterium]